MSEAAKIYEKDDHDPASSFLFVERQADVLCRSFTVKFRTHPPSLLRHILYLSMAANAVAPHSGSPSSSTLLLGQLHLRRRAVPPVRAPAVSPPASRSSPANSLRVTVSTFKFPSPLLGGTPRRSSSCGTEMPPRFYHRWL